MNRWRPVLARRCAARMLVLLVLLVGGAQAAQAALTPDAIREVVNVDVPVMRGCYELFLTENPDLAGTFTIELEIATDGMVHRAVILESTLRHTELEGCVLAVARAWAFPAPDTQVTIQYPFNFRPTTLPTVAPPVPETTAGTPVSETKPPPVDADHPAPEWIIGIIVGLLLLLGFILHAMR